MRKKTRLLSKLTAMRKDDFSKCILISGASRGIGEALARHYAKSGHHLILIGRDVDRLIDVSTNCQRLGATTTYAALDLRDKSRLSDFILKQDQATPIDLVIANAGIATTLKPHWQPEPQEQADDAFAVNVQGTLNTICPLFSPMIERNRGQIAIVSSLAAMRGLPQSPSYCASKAALRVYGQSLRSWLKRYHIKVNVVCPGYVRTNMSDHLHGPKPFMMSTEKAAEIIVHGLKQNKACIAFPWQLYWLTQLSNHLPSRLVDRILNTLESYQH